VALILYFHMFPLRDQIPSRFLDGPAVILLECGFSTPGAGRSGMSHQAIRLERVFMLSRPDTAWMAERLSRGPASLKELAEPLGHTFQAAIPGHRSQQRIVYAYDMHVVTPRISRVPGDGHGDLHERQEGTEIGLARLDAELR